MALFFNDYDYVKERDAPRYRLFDEKHKIME